MVGIVSMNQFPFSEYNSLYAMQTTNIKSCIFIGEEDNYVISEKLRIGKNPIEDAFGINSNTKLKMLKQDFCNVVWAHNDTTNAVSAYINNVLVEVIDNCTSFVPNDVQSQYHDNMLSAYFNNNG